ncbi:MAG: hypothetical protein K9G62_06140 [Alphaproteobacteria bacterium]|nr:hypothetical protein [Alphaproteobacteria bacterium]
MTLLDVAVAMVVIGLISAPLIHQYNIWQQKKALNYTHENLTAVKKAISDFYFENNRYPCPALIKNTRTDPEYGREDCAGTVAATDGLAGSVPFATLNIPESLTLDGWKNRITYVVTETQANITPIDPLGGLIQIRGFAQSSANICDTSTYVDYAPGNAHYVLVSHGNNGIGAYNAEGVPGEDCLAATNTPEGGNCDYQNGLKFTHHACARSLVSGPTYYDDVLEFQASVPTKIWAYSVADPEDIFTATGKVGINNLDPQVQLDVIGNVKLEDTFNLQTGEICAQDGSNCFPPKLIGGNEPDMDCGQNGVVGPIVSTSAPPQGGGRAMWGIATSKALCDMKYLQGHAIACPPGQAMRSIAGGAIPCTS